MDIGLSICRSIIEAHRVQIWITSHERPGTTFHFCVSSGAKNSHASQDENQTEAGSRLHRLSNVPTFKREGWSEGALWSIKALRDEPLPLFAAAAEREMKTIVEQQEPEVTLRQMTEGHNVVEDCGHIGLALREHPVAFLRRDLQKRNIVTCQQAMNTRDGRWLMTAGLVRQKPGSAKGVMFLTIEDESGPANVVVWPGLFEKRRRVVLGASMMAINGKIQREGKSSISSPSSSSI